MNNANAAPDSGASFRTPLDQQQDRHPASSPRMSELLRRYPNIQDGERLELVDFLKKGHPDSIALATYGAGLETRVIAVKRDHPEHFPSGIRALLPWLVLLMVPLLLVLVARFV